MAPEGHESQNLPDKDLGSYKFTYPHLVGDAQQLLFYRVSANVHCQGSRTPPESLLGLHQIAISNKHYNFDFINSPSK